MNHVTKEITTADIMESAEEGKGWGDTFIVTTNNADRFLMNNYRAKLFAAKNNEITIKWKKEIKNKNIPESVKHQLYETHPELDIF